ncbi:MAG: alpha/beta hydrolase [Anaerolineae bacterium]|nr:alpha/beta hydrolase [Anaerolineae bacterium]
MSAASDALYDRALAGWPQPCETRFVYTGLGRAHVIASGDPSAPALLLIHGAGLNATLWARQIPAFNAYFRTYAVDLPGQTGRSARVRMPTRGSAMADWIAAVLDGLGLEQTMVLGASLGGWVSLLFAAHYPERVRKLALLVPGGIAPAKIVGGLQMLVYAALVGQRGYERLFRAMAHNDLDADTLDLLVTSTQAQSLRTAIAPPRLADDVLQRVTMPTLILVGETDFFFPPDRVMARARALLPKATIHQLPESDHLLMRDQPELMMRELMPFLTS